jgi:oligopeptidase A
MASSHVRVDLVIETELYPGLPGRASATVLPPLPVYNPQQKFWRYRVSQANKTKTPNTKRSAEETAEAQSALKNLEQTASCGAISHLPVWSEFSADRVSSAVKLLLEQTDAAFTDLEANLDPSWSGMMEPLERLELRLGRALGAVGHLLSVKYSDELQAAYDAVRPDYVTLANRMGQSKALYAGMVKLRDGSHWSTLNIAQQRIVSESIRGMERAGVHLEGDQRARYQEIQQRLSQLGNDFQTNLVKEEQASRVIVTDLAQAEGIPAPLLEMAAATARQDGSETATAEAGPWHFVVNGVNYLGVMQHALSRSLREQFYRAFRSRGCSEGLDNRPLLEEMLRLRQEESRLVGFECYADVSIDAKMAPDTGAVWQLFAELEAAARPAAEQEFTQLKAFMAGADAEGAADPAPWDIPFWTERLREQRYDYDAEALREYFQMPRVLDGLFTLVQKLYGVDIVRVGDDAVPVWDPSVEFFEVRRDGETIAGFYVDPYTRPGEKRAGAWMNTVVGRSRALAQGNQTSSLPVALFVLNSRPPADGEPALMSLDEVRTLFHEFGHATQHMFTDIEEGGASGMSLVEWDAVELASQFNEYWMEHKPFLRALTAHLKTNEPLDDATLDRVIDSKNFMAGGGTLRQLLFGKVDMALHQKYGLPGSNDTESPFDIERQLAEETLVVPTLPDETQLPAFSHLFSGGYAAGYYSYKWAEVLAADAFAAFREVGLDNDVAVAEVAERFRETVLGLGGSLPAGEVYRRFRGRDASTDALLVDNGLKEAAS